MRIAITNIGKCFKVSNQDPDQNEIDDLFAVVEITYTGNNRGSLSIVYYDGPYKSFGYEDYEFPYEMTGNYWHVEGFGKKFEAGCEVKDKKNNTSFYNDMRNRIAGTYLDRIKSNPDDRIALKEFLRLANDDNVTRDRGAMLGNNCILDEMQLYR